MYIIISKITYICTNLHSPKFVASCLSSLPISITYRSDSAENTAESEHHTENTSRMKHIFVWLGLCWYACEPLVPSSRRLSHDGVSLPYGHCVIRIALVLLQFVIFGRVIICTTWIWSKNTGKNYTKLWIVLKCWLVGFVWFGWSVGWLTAGCQQ